MCPIIIKQKENKRLYELVWEMSEILSKASTKEHRKYLSCLYAQDGYLHATNGVIIVRIPYNDLKSGLYSVTRTRGIIALSPEDGEMPTSLTALFKKTGTRLIDVNIGEYSKSQIFCDLIRDTGTFNSKIIIYFNQFSQIPCGAYEAYILSEKDPLLLMSNECSALIMPLARTKK